MNLAAQGARLAADMQLPTVAELIHIALTETDFIGDLCSDHDLIAHNAANSIDTAADIWTDTHDGKPVPLSLIVLARGQLEAEAHDMLTDMAEMKAAELADAIEAGDLDADGTPIPYTPYRSA